MRKFLHNPIFWPMLALIALIVLNVIVRPSFVSIQLQDGHLFGSLIDILRNCAPVLLIALGMTLVIATRGIDLSVGAVAAIAGAVACVTIASSSNPASLGTAIIAMTSALAVCIFLGLWNGFLVAVLGIQPIIATLVLMVAGRGVAMLITGAQITTVNNDFFSWISTGYVLTLPVAILIAGVVVAATAILTRKTALGMLIESVGVKPEASRLAGVSSRTILWTVYAFCGFCAGLAGLMIAANTSAADANNAGLFIEMDAILAVVIGGTSLNGGRFSLAGTTVGALLIQTIDTTIPSIGIPSALNDLFKAVVVIAVFLIQSPRTRDALNKRQAKKAAAAAPTTTKEKVEA